MSRYVYTEGGQPIPGGPVEVSEEWTNAPLRAQTATEELTHGHIQATDGTDLSTKRRRREYMARNGLADSSDFTQHWQTKAKERAEHYSSGRNRKAVTQAAVEAYNKLRKP